MSMKQRNESVNFALKLVNETLTGQGALKGKSAYEIAVLNGFVGTESEWVASLKGQPLDIKGQYNTYQLLKGANPDHSCMYAVGAIQPYDIYFWSNPQNDWINAGKLNGINEIAVGANSYFPVDNKILLPDFATANQGTKADNAMPKSGGAFTGEVVFSNGVGSSQILTIKKLWENASPTSAFAPQTINLDLTLYDGIIVTQYPHVSMTEWSGTSATVFKSGRKCGLLIVYSATGGLAGSRKVEIVDNGVNVKSAYGKTDNAFIDGVIPHIIYGFKGVQNV